MTDYTGRCFGRMGINECPFTIGRASDNDYVIDDLSVSGHHASIENENGRWVLVDQGSLNKILVGGTPVSRVPLTDRMEVSLGNTRVRFCKEEQKAEQTVAYHKISQIEEWY